MEGKYSNISEIHSHDGSLDFVSYNEETSVVNIKLTEAERESDDGLYRKVNIQFTGIEYYSTNLPHIGDLMSDDYVYTILSFDDNQRAVVLDVELDEQEVSYHKLSFSYKNSNIKYKMIN